MIDDIYEPPASPKDFVRQIIDSMPLSATLAELVDEIRLAAALEESEQEIRAGKGISQEELIERFRRERQSRESHERT